MNKLKVVLFLTVTAALLAAPAAVRADVQIGVKAGGNVARPTGLQSWDPGATLKSKSGFTGGVFLALNYGRFLTVQWEALYTMKGAVYAAPGAATQTLAADYLEVPLLLKLRVPAAVIQPFVFAGPTVGFKLKERFETDGEETPSGSAILKNNDCGAVFGAGLNLGPSFMLDVRYSQGLQRVVTAAEDELPADFRNGVWSMSLGIVF
jgi:Outer membrane protein beta-barrel domain